MIGIVKVILILIVLGMICYFVVFPILKKSSKNIQVLMLVALVILILTSSIIYAVNKEITSRSQSEFNLTNSEILKKTGDTFYISDYASDDSYIVSITYLTTSGITYNNWCDAMKNQFDRKKYKTVSLRFF